MLVTLKCMDNLQYIKCHQRICHFFFTFNFTCCKFVALIKNTLTHFFRNHYSRQTKHPPQSFPYGEIRMLHEGKELWGVFLQDGKFELSSSIGYKPHQKIESPCPSLDHRPQIGEEGISNSF